MVGTLKQQTNEITTIQPACPITMSIHYHEFWPPIYLLVHRFVSHNDENVGHSFLLLLFGSACFILLFVRSFVHFAYFFILRSFINFYFAIVTNAFIYISKPYIP